MPKWNVRVIERGSAGLETAWGVRFSVDNQSFDLDYHSDVKEEAEWMRDMMIVAINRILSPVDRKEVHREDTGTVPEGS